MADGVDLQQLRNWLHGNADLYLDTSGAEAYLDGAEDALRLVQGGLEDQASDADGPPPPPGV